MQLSELATAIGAELRNASGDQSLRGVSCIALASKTSLVFATDDPSLQAALASHAAAVITTAALAATRPHTKPLLIAAHPKLAFARAAALLADKREAPSIHPTAVIASTATLAPDVSIGAYAVIEAEVQIGAGTLIDAGAVIGKGAVIGTGCRIYPRVVIYPGARLGDRVVVHAGAVLGSDGFGYVLDPATGGYIQFPQQGTIIIEDDVEIGANTTVDRGALEETRIARGTKIDNLVHIGHNVRVGSDVVIAAQTGVSGSTTIGDAAIIGGQVGIGDHADIGPQVVLGSGSGVLPHKKLRQRGVVLWGIPARPLPVYLKELAALARLGRSRERGSATKPGRED